MDRGGPSVELACLRPAVARKPDVVHFHAAIRPSSQTPDGTPRGAARSRPWPEPSGRTARRAGGSLAAASTRMRGAPERPARSAAPDTRGRAVFSMSGGRRTAQTRSKACAGPGLWRGSLTAHPVAGDALTSAPCGALRRRAVRGVVLLRRASERIAGAARWSAFAGGHPTLLERAGAL